MKTKKVNRYYCEFCKKSGCSAPHMHKHEKRCTMNPNRECGVCAMLDEEQPPMEALLAALPNIDDFPYEDLDELGSVPRAFLGAAEVAMPCLREVAGNCPACILAALRQAKVPVPAMQRGFDFSREMKGVWSDFNDAQDVGAGR